MLAEHEHEREVLEVLGVHEYEPGNFADTCAIAECGLGEKSCVHLQPQLDPYTDKPTGRPGRRS